MGTKDECKFIEPPDFLKTKIVKGKGLDWKTIDSRARTTLADMKSRFLDHLGRELAVMDKAMERARGQDASERTAALRTLYDVSHDLRGQGSTFDYPLITSICCSLCDFIEHSGRFEEVHLEAIALQLSALKAVAAGRIEGDGGTLGEELMSGIEELVTKARMG